MTNLTANALTNGHQVSYTIPLDFTPPRFLLGQLVEVIDKQGYGDIKGCVVGMTYTSRDAALAENCYPGWSYTIETPAFEHPEAHHHFREDRLQPLAAQEEA